MHYPITKEQLIWNIAILRYVEIRVSMTRRINVKFNAEVVSRRKTIKDLPKKNLTNLSQGTGTFDSTFFGMKSREHC